MAYCSIHSITNNKLIHKLINHQYFTNSMMFFDNNEHSNLLLLMVNNKKFDMISDLIESPCSSINLFKQKYKNLNIFELLLVYKKYKVISDILNSRFGCEELLLMQCENGLVINNLWGLKTYDNIHNEIFIGYSIILNLPYITEKCINHADIHGYTLLTYAISSDLIDTVKQILEHPKCNKQLLLTQLIHRNEYELGSNKYIYNCIFPNICQNTEIFSMLIESPYFTKELFYQNGSRQLICIVEILLHEPDWVDILIEKKMLTSEVYKILLDVHGINILYILLIHNPNIFRKLLYTSMCSVDRLLKINCDIIRETNCISELIIRNDFQSLKEVLNLNMDFNFSYEFILKHIITHLFYNASKISVELFDILIQSKCLVLDILLKPFINEVSLIAQIFFSKNIKLIKYLVENGYWNTIKYTINNSGNSILFDNINTKLLSAGYSLIKYLIDNDLCDKKLIKHTNNFGETILHNYINQKLTNNDDYDFTKLVELILNSKFCDKDLLNMKDFNNNTCLHIACSNEDSKFTDIIVKNKFCDSEFIKLTNNLGQSSFMIALKNNKSAAQTILKSSYFSKDLLFLKDNNNDNCCTYAIKYNHEVLCQIITHDVDDFALLKNRNKYGDTCLSISAKHNCESMKYLLRYLLSNQLTFNKHPEKNNAYFIAARYQPVALKYLLDWNYNLTYDKINIFNVALRNKHTIIHYACRFNAESVKYLLKYKNDYLMNTFYENSEFITSPFLIACKYQPDAVKYILDSEYCSTKLLESEFNNMNSAEIAFRYQPSALLHIIKSKYCTKQILNKSDDIGYTIISKLKQVDLRICDLDPDKLEEMFPIMKCKNESVDSNDPAICPICYEFKKNILFASCYHQTCVGCSLRSHKCHICRKQISTRIQLF
jgi:hypothetical protein